MDAEQHLPYIYTCLPDPPVSDIARLAARRAAPDHGVDHISGLSDALLHDIVSRLPFKDAARTAVLATRWRRVWLSAPLVVVDNHLLDHCPPARADAPAVTAAVSRVLAAHPGPFRCVHLVCTPMDSGRAKLKRWLRLMAAKGVQELVLVNRPCPREVHLPGTLFRIATLTRLYVGIWKFPDVASLGDASFPNLRELGILSVVLENGDVEAVVARSPVLEILNIQGSMKGLSLRLDSQSLRCVQICDSVMESVVMVDTPRLKRLILYKVRGSLNPASGLRTGINIANAPNLKAFGYLEPGKHAFEAGGTIIMYGVKPSASTMFTSVTKLSLNVRFGVHEDAKMVPTFLKCFPNVSSLHIRCERCDEPTGKLELKFWDEVGPIVSIMLRIEIMTIREFRGEEGEIAFVKYFLQNARVLRHAVFIFPNPDLSSISRAKGRSIAGNLTSLTWGSTQGCGIMAYGSADPEGGRPWCFKTGADFSRDPFCW
ncbi:putative FBD-associated F-box protein At5g22720 [Hordeum vulgare subsp. vulgare]|uniref:F-box domain-containing protein n=1 Tax=Hordeum vulgare subsp. vulgare TaxID=112509 RepID=A0A8I6Z784_HORVV|nr:putative FBD-associated F-box protein At5g22720 [Hordeum vulgare subsp. vulgare]KAI4970927.1 hypothetical protein ZWY2020_001841 [Hordeum vulgare]